MTDTSLVGWAAFFSRCWRRCSAASRCFSLSHDWNDVSASSRLRCRSNSPAFLVSVSSFTDRSRADWQRGDNL